MKRLSGLGVLWIVIVSIVACASKPVTERLGEPPETSNWRIAVLPAMPAPAGEGDKTPSFDSEKLREIRQCFALQLPRENFDVISLPRVDAAISSEDSEPSDPESIVRLARQLDARVVILPELFSWDRDYYLVHSVSRVGLRVSLFDGKTGAPLFRSSREDVRNQGILKIPLGYGGVAYGPIRGVLHFQMSYLCDRVSRDVAEDLAAYAASGNDASHPAPSP